MRQKNALSVMLLIALAAASPLLALGQHTGHEMSNVDRQFVMNAMRGNEDEIASARTESSSSNPSVRTFAQTVYRDHAKASAQLEALAMQYNLRYPTPGPAPKALPSRQYMEKAVADHKKAIALYQDEIKHGRNTAIRQYASATLPTLEKHLSMAEQYVATGH